MLSSKTQNSPRTLRCIRISWKWSVNLTGQWWGRGWRFKMLWVGFQVYVSSSVIYISRLSMIAYFHVNFFPSFPRRRVHWGYSWVIQYPVNNGKMQERFRLRQISKLVKGSLRGRSKLKEGSWRSVFFEDLRVTPRLMMMFLLDTFIGAKSTT